MNAVYLNKELARPIGIVDATRVGGARRRPRTTTLGLTDTTVTRADGTGYTIARSTRPRAGTRKRTTRTIAPDTTRRANMAYQPPASRYQHNFN